MMYPSVTLAQQDGSFIDRLLGLRELHWSDSSAGLGFEYALPGWVWVLIVLAAIFLAGWSYRRLLGPRFARVVLALVRAVTLTTIAALLAGPTLVLPQETIEQDWLLVLIDRSASMRIKDLADDATGEPISRDRSVREALRAQAGVFSADGLSKDHRVAWLGFGASSYPIGSPLSEPGLDEPKAQATAIRSAIEQAIRLPAGKPISGIVLISDGQTPQDTGQALTQRLAQQGVCVFVVPVGAAVPPTDIAIGQVDSPQRAFVNDTAPVSVTIEQIGAEDIDPSQISVQLIDEADVRLLDEKTLDQTQPGRPLLLTGKSSTVGTVKWRIRVEHKPGPGQVLLKELVAENNTRVVEVEVIDRPIRVLYIEGYPRWEFRYLKNLLIREPSISSSIFLLSADRGFAQEGDVPITRIPVDAQEMDSYDVLILGDVPPGYFTAKQWTLMRDHVSASGAGLIWIGGEAYTPSAYADTPLADLLPMRRPGEVARAGVASSRFKIRPTDLAGSLNVMRLRAVGIETPQQDGWPEDLPPLRWVQELGALKPTADVLATFAPSGSDDPPIPAVVRMRYGAGQSLYVGTDEAWRWRYGRGEVYFEQYWVQWVRMLGRGRVQADFGRARFSVSHRSVRTQQPVVVELELNDPSLTLSDPSRVTVWIHRGSTLGGDLVDELELLPVNSSPASLPEGAARLTYRAVWRPSLAGTMVLSVSNPALADLGLTRTLNVEAPDDETLNPRTDHRRLAELSEQTGGQVVSLDELDRLLRLVPNRARITPTDIREPLWASPASMVVVLILLFIEWVIRRVIRLA